MRAEVGRLYAREMARPRARQIRERPHYCQEELGPARLPYPGSIGFRPFCRDESRTSDVRLRQPLPSCPRRRASRQTSANLCINGCGFRDSTSWRSLDRALAATRLDCRLRGNDGTGGDDAAQAETSEFPGQQCERPRISCCAAFRGRAKFRGHDAYSNSQPELRDVTTFQLESETPPRSRPRKTRQCLSGDLRLDVYHSRMPQENIANVSAIVATHASISG